MVHDIMDVRHQNYFVFVLSLVSRRGSPEANVEYSFQVTLKNKIRNDEESCINNFRLNNHPKDHHHLRHLPSRHIDHSTYTRQPKGLKYQRGSLENVSNVKPERNLLQDPPSLRRCRSLALTKEDVFNTLEIRDGETNRRAQLIPRAKLVERNPREPRYSSRVSSTGDLSIRTHRTSTRHQSNSELPSATRKLPRREHHSNASLDTSRYPLENEYDSLEYQPLPVQKVEEPAGLNLPHYYPDSRYESDNTDNISVIDNISVSTVGYKKYLSCDNLSIRNFQEGPESISYDENIVLSKNRPLYNSLQESLCEKPRTIRSPSALTSEEYFSATSTKSENNEEQQKNNRNLKKTLKQKKLFYNSNESSTGLYSNIEINPLYEPSKSVKKEIVVKEELEQIGKFQGEKDLATRIDVDFDSKPNPDDYKTVVRVDSNLTSISSTTDEETKAENKEKQHSHNYLKEFLESQKGSKKPLQNFLSKKFPNLSRKNSKEKRTNLIDNNFYSLPDITACKNLKKCDKIDRKLRKCEKSGKSENRFIVNIGKHFDISANSDIPVDFELKIAKVPRKDKLKRAQQPEDFLNAVKHLKQTLENNSNTKPEIVELKTKNPQEAEDFNQSEIEITMDLGECTLEYQEKLGSMRTYWNKLVGNKPNEVGNKDKDDSKCKIVDVTTKVGEVKKKFEKQEEVQEKVVNKVQITKQIFEHKPVEKTEKVSPLIKNTCSFFENPCFDKGTNANLVEIIERKEEAEDKNNFDKEVKKETAEKRRPHKAVTKSLSITYPEFDHVRYRVVKSDLFQKKIFANCEKESQFDGLMQYLQDYSFQELLMDNNIVIIEPIRTTIIRENNAKYQKPMKNITPLLHKNNQSEHEKNGLRKHFFYHPIRVNKEVNDDELPNPDTVKQVRQLFEKTDKYCNSTNKTKEKNTDPDKDHCSVESNPSNNSEPGDAFESFDEEPCCEQQYITEDMMEKIRKYGTTITYYGGRIVRKQSSHDSLTNMIMEEIKNNEMKDFHCKYDTMGEKDSIYQGLSFKLVKSNSCSSRLELVGTQNLAASKQKYFSKHKELTKDKRNETKPIKNQKILDKNEINESIKKQTNMQENIDNKIYTKWGDAKQEQTIFGIQFNDKVIDKIPQKIKYDFHNFDQLKNKTRVIEDMDFEPYEIA
ncbi:hypothetical protein HHI36_004126 [Cryptolaemus montrouzieri]|uniref:Uncharacterized protein n=1 Tax=Cryptolaemus montrouzieri TaxID=559131 RepID=A0ABD2NQX6_9CUCU